MELQRILAAAVLGLSGSGFGGLPAQEKAFRDIVLLLPADLQRALAAARSYTEPVLHGWKDVRVRLSGTRTLPVRIRVRGTSSAKFEHKSFTVKLPRRRTLAPGVEVRKLFLLNLAFDPHGFEMRFCNGLARSVGLFPPHTELVRVSVNDAPSRLNLLVERPRDAIRRRHPRAVSVLRLGAEGFETKWAEKGLDEKRILEILGDALTTADAGEQARRLAAVVDLDAFYSWMALNSLVQNADSGDELFFYEVSGKLGVMGWDYDDIQAPPSAPELVHRDPLTWASETPIERAVLTNEALRGRYRARLAELLHGAWSARALVARVAKVGSELAAVDPERRAARERAMTRFRSRLLARRAQLLRLLRPAAAPGR